jgi:uncharacterized protein
MIDQITSDLKAAMLAHDTLRVGVLRMLRAEIKNQEIATGAELTDADLQGLIRKEVKKRRDAVSMYTQGGAAARAEQESAEAEILAAYLPAAPDNTLVTEFLRTTFTDQNLAGNPAAKGMLIRTAREHFGANLDGSTLASLVDQVLSA